jgi:teichuronic acid biosynthesis glycosyltransferase TuaH
MQNSRTRILYLMHIDWRWIKQRPQFIAEGLSEKHRVFVLYIRNRKLNLKYNYEPSLVHKLPLFHIPKSYQITLLHLIKKIYFKSCISLIKHIFKPSMIWLTHPELLEYIRDPKIPIIYDCMDDAVSLSFSPTHKRWIELLEANLLNRASIVFVSSQNLLNIKVGDSNKPQNIILVRNAFDGNVLENNMHEVPKRIKTYKILYYGTIATWFDFDLLKSSLAKFNNIEYHLIGPIERIDSSKIDKRIKLLHQLKHSDLMEYAKEFDILIMPFKVNDTVKAVDPVKLYEYINLNKFIISVYYPELKRYSRFVEFYRTYDEYFRILSNIEKNGIKIKYTNQDRIDFLSYNSWANRIDLIERSISKIQIDNQQI